MDNLGFGLEHYDGIGAFRMEDNGFAIDATGVLPGGKAFDGAQQLAAIIAEDPRFDHCVAEKMFTRAVHIQPECVEALRELRLINMRREKSKGLVRRLLRR